jgi:hypothetical protein
MRLRHAFTIVFCGAAIAGGVATAAAGPRAPAPCAPGVTTIGAHRAIAYCGPATVDIHIAGATFHFRNGLCDRSATAGGLELNAGTLVQGAAGNAGKPFVSLLIARLPSSSEGFEADAGGRQLFGESVIGPSGTLYAKGSFVSLLGGSFSGSWNCHGVIFRGP